MLMQRVPCSGSDASVPLCPQGGPPTTHMNALLLIPVCSLRSRLEYSVLLSMRDAYRDAVAAEVVTPAALCKLLVRARWG